MPILSFLVALIIILLVFWAARQLLAAFGVGEPIATVVNVALIVLTILVLLSFIGGMPPLQWR